MSSQIRVIPVPCLTDNYAYLVFTPEAAGDCVVIDPSEAEPVRAEAFRRGLNIRAILNTHHHYDHVGGNQELVDDLGLSVYGHESDRERIPRLTHPLKDGQQLSLFCLELSILHIPGHTLGAVAFLTGHVCFTGDTLFCGGCGRLFEGSPEQMHHSLNERLASLPPETEIYCGHEYTESNLEFALTVEQSSAVQQRLTEVKRRRAAGQFCASAPLSVEIATNPFLRCHEPHIQEALGAEEELQAFAALRKLKDKA